mgnify:CR=1 FL=1
MCGLAGTRRLGTLPLAHSQWPTAKLPVHACYRCSESRGWRGGGSNPWLECMECAACAQNGVRRRKKMRTKKLLSVSFGSDFSRVAWQCAMCGALW